jgi:hypothetical protein
VKVKGCMMNVNGPCPLLAKMWCKFHIFVLKTCFIISHSLTPDFLGVMCFLLCSYFCGVTMLLPLGVNPIAVNKCIISYHLLLCVFGLHILSVCVGLFSFFIPIFCYL